MNAGDIICLLWLTLAAGDYKAPAAFERHVILQRFHSIADCHAWLAKSPMVFRLKRWKVKQGPQCLPLVGVRR